MQRRQDGPGEVPIASPEEHLANLPSTDEALRAMEARATGTRRASVACRLFVGSMSWDTTTEDLRTAFSQFGQVTDATVMMDRNTGRSRGFGFVTMEDRRDAARAVEALNGSELQGRSIVVNVATER